MTAPIAGSSQVPAYIDIHYLHQRGKGANPFPLLLTHGYPDSFYRFAKLIPMLTDPESFGGRAEDSFDVIVPDLPGYGFSGKPTKDGIIFRIGDMWANLMTDKLGYSRFGAHGGDWGSTVTEQLARDHSDVVAAIHLTDVPFGHIFQKPGDLSSSEEKFFEENDEWMKEEGTYALIQSTKPHSLAPALNDSPVGLAAWLVEKFSRLERLRGQNRITVYQGRAPDPHHDLLGNGINWHIPPAVLRLCQCGRRHLDCTGNQEADRFFPGTGRLCPLS